MKKLIFGLIAAAIGGIATDLTEKGLNALDERRNNAKAADGDEAETETEETETDEDE